MIKQGFTLIELLIVVAIIAILAAIAVPNFLEAQTRAKISRMKSDMRSVSTAIETYHIDANKYPPPYGIDIVGRDSWAVISTPIAYITQGRTDDVFAERSTSVGKYTLTYELINPLCQIIEVGGVAPYSVDPMGQIGVWWWIACRGPDKKYGFKSGDPEYDMRQKFFQSTQKPGDWLSVIYDASNGTTSIGNIYRAGGAMTGFAAQTMNL